MIYHYTSVNTLESILRTKKLRFGRLDNVDDRIESEPFSNKPIADKIFVSCWTEDQNENVALWKMYGDDFRGVRIGLNEPYFTLKSVRPEKWKGINIKKNKGNKILFNLNEILTKEYFIIPSFMTGNAFRKKIEYIPFSELESKYDKLTKVETEDGINYNLSLDFQEIAKYKSEEWKAQEEARFVLGIVPLNRDFTHKVDFENKEFQRLFISEMLDAIINERKLKFNYFDVELDSTSLKNIKITAGPKCNLLRIKKLYETYALKQPPEVSILNLK